MGNSLGEYNIARSSSQDIKNIKSSQRHPTDPNKPKKKKRNTSPTNIIYESNPKASPEVKKIIKINSDSKKSKNKKTKGKSVQNASAANYIIKPGFTRPGR